MTTASFTAAAYRAERERMALGTGDADKEFELLERMYRAAGSRLAALKRQLDRHQKTRDAARNTAADLGDEWRQRLRDVAGKIDDEVVEARRDERATKERAAEAQEVVLEVRGNVAEAQEVEHLLWIDLKRAHARLADDKQQARLGKARQALLKSSAGAEFLGALRAQQQVWRRQIATDPVIGTSAPTPLSADEARRQRRSRLDRLTGAWLQDLIDEGATDATPGNTPPELPPRCPAADHRFRPKSPAQRAKETARARQLAMQREREAA